MFYTAFDKRFSKINLNARDTSFLRVEAYNVSKSDFTVSLTFLSKAEALELQQNALHKAINGVILSLVLLGTMIGMFLYFFFNFIQTKRRELLLYSVYIFFIILNYIIRLDGFLQVYLLFEENPIRYFQLGEPIQSVMYISYLYFICDFLNVKKHNIRLYRFMVFQILMFVVIGIIFSYFSFVERDIMFVQDELGVLWYIHFITF